MKRLRLGYRFSALLLLGLVGGCAAVGEAERASQGEPVEAEQVELSTVMARMQLHADKLGYSVQAQNRPLATFYLEELEETFEDLAAVSEHDGFPIGHTAGVILAPLFEGVESGLADEDWAAATTGYATLVDGCNRCHAATEHEYLVIVPVSDHPPYSQRFAPAG